MVPPGRYTVLVVATSADGTKVVRRVHVTIHARKRTAHVPATASVRPRAVVVPVGPAAPPSSGDSAAPKPKPTATDLRHKPTPAKVTGSKSHPLETAAAFVKEKPGRSVGFLILLFCLGAGLAALIRIEMGRMLSTRRFS